MPIARLVRPARIQDFTHCEDLPSRHAEQRRCWSVAAQEAHPAGEDRPGWKNTKQEQSSPVNPRRKPMAQVWESGLKTPKILSTLKIEAFQHSHR